MSLNYNSLTALTKNKFIPVLVDNIFNSNVLTFKLLKNAEKLDGGVKIITPLEVAKGGYNSSNYSGFYAEGADLTPQTNDPFSAAEWNWKQAYAGLYITAQEELKNSGDSAVLSLLKAKMKNAEMALKDMFGDKLFPTAGAAVGANDITAIGYDNSGTKAHRDNKICAGGMGATTAADGDSSLGGINGGDETEASIASAYSWWLPQTLAFSGDATADGGDGDGTLEWSDQVATSNGVSNIVKDMTRMYGKCTVDNDQPDLIITGQVLYDAYESSLQGNKRFDGDASLGDAGFQSLRFKGASVVVDSHVPAGEMYFLNTKYLDFKTHSKRDFTPEPWKVREQQDGSIMRIFWMGNLVCTNRRMQGVLHSGATSY